MATKEGWTGRYYEDFEVGDVYQHPLGRTVTTTDNIWFTLLTQNTAPIHFDHHYSAQTEFGKPLVDSTFTLALVTGQTVTDISQNVVQITQGVIVLAVVVAYEVVGRQRAAAEQRAVTQRLQAERSKAGKEVAA